MIADNLSKAGWSWGYVSTVDSGGRTIWIADAHRGDGKRFIVRADAELTALLEFETPIQSCARLRLIEWHWLNIARCWTRQSAGKVRAVELSRLLTSDPPQR